MNELERKAEIADILIRHLILQIDKETGIKSYVLDLFGFGISNKDPDFYNLEKLFKGEQ